MKGYVRIKVWGFSPERFMNLCSNHNILLWDIVKEGDVYYMCISLSAFYELRPIVRKTGTRAVILKRYGLPFFVPVIWARKVFIIGFIMCIVFWIWSTFYIWDIQLEGNYQITQDVFFSFLQEKQVKVGMKKENLSIEELEKEIRRTFPQITWTSAKMDGTRLLIEIKENDAPMITTIKKEEGASDLVADFNGKIVSMIVRSGVPKAAIGDEVEEGSILVEGKVPVYNEDTTVREYQYVTADADIMIQHETHYEETLPYDYVQKEYTGREKTRYFLRVGEKELKWTEDMPFLVYDCVIRENRPEIFEKLSIPIYWGSLVYREYQNVEHEYTLSQAKTILEEKIKDFLITLSEKGVQIIEKNVKIDSSNRNWIISGDFTVIEKAGKSQDTLIENVEQPVAAELEEE